MQLFWQDLVNGILVGGIFAVVALGFMLAGLLVLGAKRPLSNLMVLVALIQLLDITMDVVEGRWMVIPGVFLFGVMFLIGASRLCEGTPLWKIEAWVR